MRGREWLIQNADPEEWRRKLLNTCGAVDSSLIQGV
jgi:hypothetical protein